MNFQQLYHFCNYYSPLTIFIGLYYMINSYFRKIIADQIVLIIKEYRFEKKFRYFI